MLAEPRENAIDCSAIHLYFSDSMLGDDLIFLRGQFLPQCAHDIDKHFEDYCTLQYSDGVLELAVDEERWRLEGKWFWSAWPGPRVAFHPAGGHRHWIHRFIAFRGPAAERWTKEGLFPVRPQRPPAGMNGASQFDKLLSLFQQAETWSQRKAVHVLEGILIELAAARGGTSGPSAELQPILRRLESPGSVDYGAIAASEGLSVRTLRRRFHKELGCSPHEYLLAQRIEAAKQLLTGSDLPIKEISRRLGYRDVFYFTRQFTRRTGTPPAVYRRSWEG